VPLRSVIYGCSPYDIQLIMLSTICLCLTFRAICSFEISGRGTVFLLLHEICSQIDDDIIWPLRGRPVALEVVEEDTQNLHAKPKSPLQAGVAGHSMDYEERGSSSTGEDVRAVNVKGEELDDEDEEEDLDEPAGKSEAKNTNRKDVLPLSSDEFAQMAAKDLSVRRAKEGGEEPIGEFIPEVVESSQRALNPDEDSGQKCFEVP